MRLAGHAARQEASVTSRSTAASLLGQRRRSSEGLRRRCHSTPLVVKSGSKPQSAAPGDGLKSGMASAGNVHNEAGSGGGLASGLTVAPQLLATSSWRDWPTPPCPASRTRQSPTTQARLET